MSERKFYQKITDIYATSVDYNRDAVTMNTNGDYGIPVPDYIEENVSTKVVKIIHRRHRHCQQDGLA